MGRQIRRRRRAAGVGRLAEWFAGFSLLAGAVWVGACSDPAPSSDPESSPAPEALETQPEAMADPGERPSTSTAATPGTVTEAVVATDIESPSPAPAAAPAPNGARVEASPESAAGQSLTSLASVSPSSTRAADPVAPAGSAEVVASGQGAGFLTRLSADCAVTLNRVFLARDVDRPQREPLGVSRHFVADGSPVYIFMDVHNPTGPQQDMTIRWEHLASDHTFTQTIPAGTSPRWRTWVYHRIWPGQLGDWRVEILTPSACQVAELTFETST